MKLKIGENIRHLRRKADLTQQQFADQMGVSCQSVSRWENGETYPDMELLPAIADFFHTSVDSLMGILYAEKEKQAHETFDALRRECLEPQIDTEKVVSLIRDIRRNFLDSTEAWRLWVGNNRCFRMPEVLPEIRQTAEAYLALHPMDYWVIETMAMVEDEEKIEDFLSKFTPSYDLSRRTLLFERYLERGDRERLEPERRFKFYQAFDDLFEPVTLLGLIEDTDAEDDAAIFQSKLLDLVREEHGGCEPDKWVCERLNLGISRASISARGGKIQEALCELEEAVLLLENTMRISAPQELKTNCRWLCGMTWIAEEIWDSPSQDLGMLERAVTIYTDVSGMNRHRIRIHFLIYPSIYRDNIANLKGKECLEDLPQYQALLSRLDALIEHRPRE